MDPDNTSLGQTTWLLPGLDLLNSRASSNAWRHATGSAAREGDARVEIRAKERIAAGDELFWPYHSDHARVDVSLLVYGMVNESDTRLAAVDRVGWSAHDAFAGTPDEDPDPASMALPDVAGELARLQFILRGLPSSLDEDRAALAAAEASADGDFRVTEILRFRVVRKAALTGRIAALRAVLQNSGASSAHEEL